MTLISKNVYIDKLNDIVNKYNNIYPRTIKMKSDVKNNTYIDFNKEVNDKDPKFKIGDYLIISKYKIIFAKGYTTSWSEEVLRLKKLKILFHEHTLLQIVMVRKLLEPFMKKNCKRLIKRNLE